jgi:uncharacterized membrane protein YhhN
MVGVAQLVEHLVVVQDVAGSSPVTHPTAPVAPLAYAGAVRHRRVAAVSLVAYVVVAVADVLAELSDAYLLTRLLPVLLMPLLAGFLWWSAPRTTVARWVLLALGFAWLGDCLGYALLVKIIFFFGTQVAYCLAFLPRWPYSLLRRPGPLTAYAVVSGALIAAVSLRAGPLSIPVIVYGISLVLMIALATGVSRLTTLGAVVFLVSDLVLAYGVFVDPPASPVNRAAVMATYLLAQLMIVLGTRRQAMEAVAQPRAGVFVGRR